MKNFNYLLLLFLFCSEAYSQNKKLEESILECQYKLVMQKDTISKSNLVEDEMVLRVGETTSQFFSRHTFYHDSLWADPEGREKAEDLSIKSLMSQIPSQVFGARTTKDFLYINHQKEKMTTYSKDFINVNFYFEEDYSPQKWIICDTTKILMGYECTKAECYFRGRNWIAWFAEDIPIADGPWKLNGLPGLILETYDSKMDYHYTATCINMKPTFPVTYYKLDEYREMETDRITYNDTLEKYLKGADIGELDLLQRALKEGIPLKFEQRRTKKLRYDLLERDHLTP